MKNKKGQLLVISGPSGVGKGTILAAVMEKNKNLSFSVSATTRNPRPGEIDGEHYYFVTKEKFFEMVDSKEMLEYAEYSGNYYGTPKKAVEKKLEEGLDVALDIDVQGAFQIMEIFPDALFIFIIPPTIDELSRRLAKRGTEDEESVAKRLSAAKNELKQAAKFNYIVINNALEDAVANIEAIISAGRCRSERMSDLLESLNKI